MFVKSTPFKRVCQLLLSLIVGIITSENKASEASFMKVTERPSDEVARSPTWKKKFKGRLGSLLYVVLFLFVVYCFFLAKPFMLRFSLNSSIILSSIPYFLSFMYFLFVI